MISISVESEEEPWLIDGQRRWTDDGYLMLKPSEVQQLEVNDLRDALTAYVSRYGNEEQAVAVVYDGGDEAFFDVDAPAHQVEFILHENQVAVSVELALEWPDEDDFASTRAALKSTAEAFASPRGATIISLSDDGQIWQRSHAPGFAIVTLTMTVPTEFTRLGDVFALGQGVAVLVDALVARTPSRDTLTDLIRGGNAYLLVGQPEGNWLDVKSQEWDMKSHDGKHRLATEVAAFCNAEEGGIIVIGARTSTPIPGGGEIITDVSGLNEVRCSPRTYMQVLSNKIVPLPFGLGVEVIQLPSGALSTSAEI